jgi:hypothetical protein
MDDDDVMTFVSLQSKKSSPSPLIFVKMRIFTRTLYKCRLWTFRNFCMFVHIRCVEDPPREVV